MAETKIKQAQIRGASICVLDKGASTSASAATNNAAFAAAAAAAAGAPVFVPPGNYTLSTQQTGKFYTNGTVSVNGTDVTNGVLEVLTLPTEYQYLVTYGAQPIRENLLAISSIADNSNMDMGNAYSHGAGNASKLSWANVGFGPYSLATLTTGYRNTAFGVNCLPSVTTGYANIGVGQGAGYGTTTGNANICVGWEAGFGINGDNNVFLGVGSGSSATTPDNNTGCGTETLQQLRTGSNNTALGFNAMHQMYDGADNIAIGYNAMVYAGQEAGAGCNGNVVLGSYAMGQAAGGTHTGNNNVVIGNLAGNSLIGDSCVAIGYQTMAKGIQTGKVKSIAIGYQVNVNPAAGIGGMCIGIGDGAMDNTTGDGNIAIGSATLYDNTSGTYNTALGYRAGTTGGTTTYTNTTVLGANALVTGSNQVQLGDAATTTYAYGAVQNRSDARDKAEVRDTILGTEFIMALRPVDFKWNYREDYFETYKEQTGVDKNGEPITVMKRRSLPQDGSKTRSRYHHGFIAQEVKASIDKLGIDFGGYQDHALKGGQDVKSVGYEEVIAPLVKAFQELRAEFDAYKVAHP